MSNFQTSPQRHANMAAIHGKDTKPEMVVRRYLWGHGYRYRLNHPENQYRVLGQQSKAEQGMGFEGSTRTHRNGLALYHHLGM